MSSPPFHYLPPGPPSDALMASIRAEMQFEAQRIIDNGGGKISHIRIVVEFDNGEAVICERTP
jgi:hypothetical protein